MSTHEGCVGTLHRSSSHTYCDFCDAFQTDADARKGNPFPSGTDAKANRAAWDAADVRSPDEDPTYAECDAAGDWSVVDPQGGRWWPSAKAHDEITASDDPAATAVRIATESPMRGEWRD